MLLLVPSCNRRSQTFLESLQFALLLRSIFLRYSLLFHSIPSKSDIELEFSKGALNLPCNFPTAHHTLSSSFYTYRNTENDLCSRNQTYDCNRLHSVKIRSILKVESYQLAFLGSHQIDNPSF